MSSNDSGGAAPADHVAMLLSPLLIMALVGSLVYFLLEVLYAGEHLGNMRWILFFFVFAAVLVARIALTPEIASHAPIYTGIVTLLGWVAFIRFVEYPPHLKPVGVLISLGIVVLVWWCAHQLTRDCTWLDDKVGVAGEGILEAAGLAAAQPESTSVERYRRKQQDEEADRRTPGTWIVYFSLAALPIFGLGQSLIPADEVGRRRFTFWLMVIYVGSGLGLLLTTSFLGLRLYLQRRRLRMPLVITACWLSLGGLLIVGLLTLGALLPRPNAEVALLQFDQAKSPKRKATKKNVKEGKPGEDEGDRTKSQPQKDEPAKDGQAGKDQPEKDGQKDRGESRQGKERQEGRNDKDQQNQKDRGEPKEERRPDGASEPPPENANLSLDKFMQVLKWIVFVILALLVLFVVLRGALQFAAGFSSWARGLLDFFRRFWAQLVGGTTAAEQQAEEEERERRARELPFAAFSNPFADGRAARLSPAELIAYTFAALEAWARDHDVGRQLGDTALEFVEHVSERLPALERDLHRLGQLYSLVTYSRGAVPGSTRDVLRRFWDALVGC